jgi:hypothetical protein
MLSPRVQFTLWQMMFAVAIVAVLLTLAAAVGRIGPSNGFYSGRYCYLGADLRWHEVRGSVIYVKDGMIFVD